MANITLPEELLDKIVTITAKYNSSSLLPLSLSSRQLRRLSTPFLFERITITGTKLSELESSCWPSPWIIKLTVKDLWTDGITGNQFLGRAELCCRLIQECTEATDFEFGLGNWHTREPARSDFILRMELSSLSTIPISTFIDTGCKRLLHFLPRLPYVTTFVIAVESMSSFYESGVFPFPPRDYVFPSVERIVATGDSLYSQSISNLFSLLPTTRCIEAPDLSGFYLEQTLWNYFILDPEDINPMRNELQVTIRDDHVGEFVGDFTPLYEDQLSESTLQITFPMLFKVDPRLDDSSHSPHLESVKMAINDVGKYLPDYEEAFARAKEVVGNVDVFFLEASFTFHLHAVDDIRIQQRTLEWRRNDLTTLLKREKSKSLQSEYGTTDGIKHLEELLLDLEKERDVCDSTNDTLRRRLQLMGRTMAGVLWDRIGRKETEFKWEIQIRGEGHDEDLL